MDKFEKAVKEMAKVSKKEGKELNKDLRERCECEACPTYAMCARMKEEKLFCLWGDSDCISLGRSCICPSCTVAQEMGMKHEFFCINGPEVVQREMPRQPPE